MTITDRLRNASENMTSRRGSESARLGVFSSFIAGTWSEGGEAVDVRNPYDGSLVAVVQRAGPQEIETAIARATEAFQLMRRLPVWKRAEALEKISNGIASKREDFAQTIALEAGKPIKTARTEVDRAIFIYKVAAEESKRIYGEIVPLDWQPGMEGREAHIHQVPLGPVAGITPFNYPVSLVAHKVAPALAAGDPIIIRPASQTPVSALKLAQVISNAGLPEGAFSVVPSSTHAATPLVEDERIHLLTFTGSPAIGWSLKSRAGRKRVTLELGGNAGVIVHRDADLKYAAERVAWGGFQYAGQSCVSVQRVYIHTDVYEAFRDELIRRVRALKVGDPLDETTDVGPLIDQGAAERVEAWMEEAQQGGAQVLTGGTRSGNLWQPTILAELQPSMRVSCQEVFAPLVGLYRYTDVREAILAVDNSDFGLQAGLFTNDMSVVREAFENIEVGGLMINDVSTFRIDHMPYGGVKQSGTGREGLRYAILEMSEMKLITYNNR